MEYRILGKTGFKVSALGFGCGGVGGLMVGGDYQDMLRVVERAVEAGINYFDTAQIYGKGLSESNLGRVLQVLKPDVVVGTKIQLTQADMERVEAAIIAAVEVSLKRLQLEQIPLLQLHNAFERQRNPERNRITVHDLEAVIAAFQKLQVSGKIRAWGVNGLGETELLRQIVGDSGAATIQICYNLLNPSAGRKVPPNFPFQNYGELMNHAAAKQMGVIAFRVMAGGALSGEYQRHPMATPAIETIASGKDYEADVAQALSFRYLVTEGYVESIAEAAIRFALSHPNIATALVGISSMDQLEQALAAAQKGALPADVIAQLPLAQP